MNIVLMARETRISTGTLSAPYILTYTPEEYAGIFSADERATLDAGKKMARPHRYGQTVYVNMTALGLDALDARPN